MCKVRTWVLLLVCVALVSAEGADWPNWRGPNRDGISSETSWSWQWPAAGPTVLWKKSVGTGFSSMSICHGRVYTMGNTGIKGDNKKDAHQDVVFCFDADTGRELWQHAYLCELGPRGYEGGTSATPTVDGRRVYTLSKSGLVFCLDAESGDVVWKRDLVAECGVEIPTWGLGGGSVLIYKDLAILNAGTYGLALNKADGSLVWQNGTGKAGYSTPVLYTLDGLDCITLFNVNSLAAVTARTGEVLWTIPWKARHDENIADPIVTGNRILVSSYLGDRCSLFTLTRNRLFELWTHKEMFNWLSSSVLHQGHVYGVHCKRPNRLRCMDLNTGEILWSHEGLGLASLMMAGNQLIILSDKGKLVIAEASPEAYTPLAEAQVLTGKCWTAPVLANGKIYARNAQGELVCLDVKTP
jgi:outer membrane protein assembly factor BamB